MERLPDTQPTDRDDAALVQRAQRGDREAFGRLVRKYEGSLFNAVYRIAGHYDDAADLVQETFLKAFRAIRSFQGKSAFYTWLFQIAMNTSISMRRRAVVRKESSKVPLQPGDGVGRAIDPADGRPGPDKAAQNDELARRIEDAIAELDDDHRAVVVLKDIEGLDYQQIAQILRCPRGTVKSRLHRARLKLRAALEGLI